MAFFTVIAQYRAVKLQDSLASGGLMQSIDILRDHSTHLSGTFQLRQLFMGGVRLSFWEEHLIPVKTEEFFRMGTVKAVAQYGLRRIVVLLMVQTIHASEVRNTAFSRDAGTAEKYNVIVSINDFLQFFDLFLQIFHKLFLLRKLYRSPDI